MLMKRPIQKARGAILIMAALILVLLIGVAAFALDLGRLFVLRTEMQNAVDAAVLSAAAELDGEAGALDDARSAANQEMLNHLAHFSNQGELLLNLQETDFTFYSWIGSSVDTLDPPDPCDDADSDGKCQTTSADNASYVKIELNPALADNQRYGIDLYFLPALSVFGINTATTASTRVAALAGSHTQICNFPPMIVCYPADLNPGQMVVLKTHSGGGAWTGGEFGWTIPDTVAVDKDPIDTSGFNDGKLLAHRLGSIYGQGCSPPTVWPKSGNLGNSSIRQGINTRFGMYEGQFTGSDYPDLESLPSAPNVIGYPRDDNLTLVKGGECELDEGAPNPSNGVWNFTECHSVDDFIVITADLIVAGVQYTIVTTGDTNFITIGAADSEPGTIFIATGVGTGTGTVRGTVVAVDQQPSTYSRTAYNNVFHGGDSGIPGTSSIRADYYDWELSSSQLAVNTIAPADIHNDESQCVLGGNKKYVGENGNQNSCRMLNGEPLASATYVDDDDSDKRRELFVAAIPNCADLSEKEINVPQVGGKWVKFFLTEHVDRPGSGEGLNVYAEFIEEVIDKDDEHFEKVIQLYE